MRATLVAAVTLTLASALGAGTQASVASTAGAAESSDEAEPVGRAIVEVATPALPSGRSAAARDAWRRLRARSGGILTRVAERNELTVVGRIPETGQLAVELGDDSVAELRDRLSADPRVQRVVADRPVEFRYVPNDFAFNQVDSRAPNTDLYQWNLVRSEGPAAWDLSQGVGAEVAVIDTGAYVAHPDLAGRVAGTLDCEGGCAGGDVSDANGHGTHVSGLACADSDNSYGLASLGFDCGLFISRIALCDEASAAIVIAANRGSDAINMSFGGCNAAMADELAYAWAQGSVPVAAGANSPVPSPSYPAQGVQPEGSGPNLDAGRGLVVTSAQYNGTRSSFAQQTSGVSLAGYGSATNAIGGQQGILSTWPAATTTIETGTLVPPAAPCNCRTTLNGDNRFAYLVGTSMATPQVAGAVALVRAAKPDISPTKLVRVMKLTASHCGGYRNGLGWGVVNAHRAVAAGLGKDIDAPSSKVKKGRKGKVKKGRKGKLRIKSLDEKKASCFDELPSSGVKVVKVFVSRNGARYRKLAKTKRKFVRFRPKRKGRYRFYSVAVDKAGNREAKPDKPDIKLRVKRLPRR